MTKPIAWLNIGCGKDIIPDFINLDVFGGDLRADVRHLPFKDLSIGYARASHVLEHIIESRQTMHEIWRVLEPDALFTVRVPYGIDGLFDPFHMRAFDLETMDRFCNADPHSLEYKALFRIVSRRITDYHRPWILRKMIESRWGELVEWALLHVGFYRRYGDARLINPFPLTRRKEISWLLEKVPA